MQIYSKLLTQARSTIANNQVNAIAQEIMTLVHDVSWLAIAKTLSMFDNLRYECCSFSQSMGKKLTVVFFALILSLSQANSALANEIGASNANTAASAVSASHNHNADTTNYVAAAEHSVATINPAVVNPAIEIASILHSVVSSSLDLNSVLHNVNVGHLSHEVTIVAGNHNVEVFSNQAVTPAEALAVSQVLASNHQSLVLDALGQATGGSLNSSSLGNTVNNLELSYGVTLFDNSKALTLTGNLANYGDIVFSGSGNLTANNILNESAAQISSSGVLGLTTHELINEGAIYGANGVNINASTIYNSATVEAGLGNIDIANANTLDITGTQNSVFEAANGNINIYVNATSLSNGMNLAYSNYVSNELNLNAGSGYIQGVTNNVTGQINVNANDAHLATASKDMLLGNDLVNGDPTYVNTAGDISLNGAVASSGNNLAIIASGNINVASGSSANITTAGTSGNSGNLVMIAGASITYTGTNTTTGIPTPGTSIASGETVTVNLGSVSSTGGSIDLGTNNSYAGTGLDVINTSSTTANAGNVTLLALANGSNGGVVSTYNAATSTTFNIDATGAATTSSNTYTGGSVLVIADAAPASATNTIVLGNITTNGAVGGAGTIGSVSLYAQTPSSSSVSFDSTGTLTGSITNSGTNIANAGISVGSITTSGNNGIDNSSLSTGVAGGNGQDAGNITLSTGGNISVTGAITAGGGAGGTGSGSGGIGGIGENGGNGGIGGIGGQISLTSVNGSITTAAIESYGGAGDAGGTGSASGGIGGNGGNGGLVALSTSSTISIGGNVTSVGGDGGAGGSGYISGSIGIGGNGGAINLFSSASTTSITISGAVLAASGGDGGGSAGTSALANAGKITITAPSIIVSGTISLPSGITSSINAQGIGGTVDITAPAVISTGSSYLSNADYASGATTSAISISSQTGTITTAGSIYAGTSGSTNPITLYGVGKASPIAAGTNNGNGSSTITITESVSGTPTQMTISTGTSLTPAEYIAAVQSAIYGNQNIVLTSTATILGTGYATGGDFNVASVNIPSGNFTNLNLPTGVIENVNVAALTYTGSATIAGTMNFSNSAATLNVGSTTNITGTVTFNGTGNNAIISNGALTASGSILDPNSGNLNLTSTTSGISLAGLNAGTGNLNLTAGGSGSSISSSNLLTATTINFVTNGGDISATGTGTSPILVNAANLDVNTGTSVSNASAYISDSIAGNVNIGRSNDVVGSAGTYSLIMTNNQAGSITIVGNVNAGTDTGSGVINLTASSLSPITTAATNDILTAGTINLNTSGGDIGSTGQSILIDSGSLSLNTLNNSASSGNAYINDIATGTVTLNASSVGFTGNVLDLTVNGSLIINGLITAGSDTGTGIINLTLSGNGSLSQTYNSDIIQAGTVNFNTAGGNIGGQYSIVVDTSNLSIDTLNSGATTGYAYVIDSAANLNLNTSSVSTQSYSSHSSSLGIEDSGNITVNGLITAGTSTDKGNIYIASTVSGGNITDSGSTSVLQAGIIILNSDGGNIGSSSQLLEINASSLSFNTLNNSATTGQVYLKDTATNNLTLNTSSAGLTGSNVNLNITGNLLVDGIIAAGSSTSNNNIFLSTQGNILSTATSSIQSGYVDLNNTTATGNIGSSSQAVNVNTEHLTVFAQNNSSTAYVFNSNTNSQLGFSNLTGSLNLTTAGTVTSVFINTANNINITTQNNGSIFLQGGLAAIQNVVLIANGTGNIESQKGSPLIPALSTTSPIVGFTSVKPGLDGIARFNQLPTPGSILNPNYGIVYGSSLTLNSGSGNFGSSSQFLQTQVNNLASLTGGIGSAWLLNSAASLNLNTSSIGGSYALITSGNITGSGLQTAPVLGLYSISGSTGIGNSSNIIQINATNIGVQSFSANSSVYINDTNTSPVTLQGSSAIDILKLTTAGALTIYGVQDNAGVITQTPITASIIALQALGGYGIYNATSLNANDFVFLTASATGYIAEPNTGALMYAPNIALVSGGGAIGAGGRILLNSANVAASTVGLNNFVNIYDEAANSGIFGGQSGSSFMFNTNGNLNITGSIATGAGTGANGGAINITANGLLNIGVNGKGINLTTNNGPITVVDNDASSGSINFAKGDYIYTNTPSTATPGYIVFNVGAYAQTNTTNPNPVNIAASTSGGASIFYGVNGISAPVGGNVLNAKGQSIVFNTGSLSASAITLGGNVSITADPPVVINNTLGNFFGSSANNASSASNLSPIVNLSGAGIIQNNLANINLASAVQASSANLGVNNNASVNLLDNTQATTSINNNNVNRNRTNEYSYLSDSYDSDELVDNTSLVMPIAYSHTVDSLTAQSIKANNGLVAKLVSKCQTSRLNNLADSYNNTRLGYGSAIISASHDMEISLGKGINLSLKRGAIVLAIANGNVVSVYDLHDNSANSVVVSGNGVNAINLAPGRQVTVAKTNTAVDFAYVNQVGKIAYRSLNTTFKNGNAMYVSDFSIPSAISAVKPLKAMFRSSDAKVRALANQMLKTIVVVTQSTASSGVYEQVAKPKLTAMR